MTRLLDVINLETCFFTPRGIVRAVNGISFHVNAGETVGIVGESGSGKSVSMMSILRLIPSPPGKITNGQVLFKGEDLLRLNDQAMRQIRGHQISIILQDPMTSLNPVLTIERQMTEGLQLHLGMTRRQAKGRALELLQRVGIPGAAERLRHYPHQFSGGMRQRVTIAIGLACNPQLLIADEPTTALDVTIQAQIVDLVKRSRQEMSMAVIWISHDLALLAGLADRILVMYAGQIVEAATPNTLYNNPRHPYTIALLQSIPHLNGQRQERLQAIAGIPPDLANYPQGCPFAPRCLFAQDLCFTQDPPLESIDTQHQVACWVKPESGTPLARSPH